MKRREFTRQVRAEIVLRSTNANGFVTCEGCSTVLKRGRQHYEIDHTIAEALVVDKSRKLTAADGKLLGKECCHRGQDGKTAKDVKVISKAKRAEASYLGISAPKRSIQSRGFGPKRESAPKPLHAPRRVLYGPGSGLMQPGSNHEGD